jgi:hypothetical protein
MDTHDIAILLNALNGLRESYVDRFYYAPYIYSLEEQ